MAQQDEYEDDYFLEEDKMLENHFHPSMYTINYRFHFYKLPLILLFR